MAVVSALPGTSSTGDGFFSVDLIKQTAKRNSAGLQGASAINLLHSAKSAADAAMVKEDAGDLQEALLKYLLSANLLQNVLSSSEYKQEAAQGRHGAVYQQVAQFSQLFTKTVQPRTVALEARLKEVEEARSAAGATVPSNGSHSAKPPVTRTNTEDEPLNERPGGSLAERMAKLRGAGMDTTAKANKRLSHQSSPSKSSYALPAPLTPKPATPNSDTPSTSSQPHTNVITSPPPVNPTTSTATVQHAAPDAFEGLGSYMDPQPSTVNLSTSNNRRSPYSSPQVFSGDIPRQVNGLSHSPRHHDLRSLADGPSTRSPRLPPSSLSSPPYDASNSNPPETPSLVQFNSEFPAIEDLEVKLGATTIDGLPPSRAEDRFPSFPSVPSTPIGLGFTQRSRPSSVTESAPPQTQTQTRTSRPPSISSPPVRKDYSGGSAGPRTHLTGDSAGSQKAGSSWALAPIADASQGPRPRSSTAKRHDIPITQTGIQPKELKTILDESYREGLQVLLLDVRSRERFMHERINALDIVVVEPQILMRSGINSMGIESALVISPRAEEDSFRKRDKFDLVVVYDETSQSLSSSILSTLVREIYEREFVKKLKRPPLILVGGIKAWKVQLGTVGLTGSDLVDKPPIDVSTKPSVPTNNSSVLPSAIPPNGYPEGYRSNRPTPTDSAELSGKQLNRRAHVRDGAVFEAPGTSVVPDGTSNVSPNGDANTQSIRKSHLVRPSSSGTISAYNRPVIDTMDGGLYAAHVPITYPSQPSRVTSPTTTAPPSSFSSSATLAQLRSPPPIAPPPQASVGASPLSRRRSDYAEQSLFPYSGFSSGPQRSSIDYPALSAQNVVRPPPPVASSSMERQEVRPRGHTASYSVSRPNKGVTVIGGISIPTPETIQSYYPVYYWSDSQIGMSGLRNLGNTCYMNSTIQCLSATVPFARFFIDGRWKSAINMQNPLGTNGVVANAFSTLVHDLWQQESSYLSPFQFRKSVCLHAPQFGGSDQHDAQEFLSFLLDGLHEDLNRVLRKPSLPEPTPEREKELEIMPQQIASAQEWQLYRMRDDSIVVDYFQGQFRNRLACLTCNQTSTTYNSFMYLSLEIPVGRGITKVSLDQCLDAFVKPEVMEKSDAWKCPHCKVLRKATKQLSLSRLPPVLLIHFKRFSFKGPFTDKLETMVDFPLKNLDLTSYMPSPLPPSVDKAGAYGTSTYSSDDPRSQVPPYRYDLYGVVNHFGSLSSGHYTSFIASKGAWVYCDDSRLTYADPKDVVGRPAYILFYRRVKA